MRIGHRRYWETPDAHPRQHLAYMPDPPMRFSIAAQLAGHTSALHEMAC